MKKIVFVLLATLASCAFAADNLLLTGSSTVAPLMMEIAKRYEKSHPKIRVDVQSGGSSKGITDVREDVASIGMVSRSLKADEADLVSRRIAIDGISMIAHASNPVGNLTSSQVIKIYRGELNNWKSVGGKDARIVVINKSEGRSTLELFLQHFKLKVSDIKAQAIIGENEQGIKLVSGNPNAIAYVSIGSSEASVKNGVPIKLLDLDGIQPSSDTVKSGKFPIIRDLNLVTKKSLGAEAEKLIEFAQSKNVSDLIKEQFFVVPSAP